MEITAIGLPFFLLYVVPAIVSCVLQWASTKDEAKEGHNISLRDKLLRVYVLPIIPILNLYLIVHHIIDSLS